MVSSEKLAAVRAPAPIQLPHAQRSSSEKWSSNQQLTLEYAKRQKMSIAWIERKLGRDLFASDEVQRDDENALFVQLRSGVVLRELMEVLAPAHANKMPIARTYSKLLAPWKERENISIFLHDCRM
ncbi:hypothetical protein SPRG_09965 [Saprolegnia parasitica CBS 223.65]|uniref:Uncharacterized protein n=1 Tax=Saprolegnia parasitica (strain CBS 223.65) TaxID=695850 RepID=A0A067C8N9_SAPPC|nr:hypothetical protein SPRG_09965 [Saprolegnia parasitica CBS 223.65]KDO23157.1 hypothetical protein SPRG_09965 [Saprolegnia parasitica CBS 223.65]|eukprot:XP_012206109.1 hypothetical protein SPRG_09965 [Saprolegnia parasitica CBS 223.65]